MIQHQTLKVKVPNGELPNYLTILNNQAKMQNYIRLTEIEQKLAEDNTLDYQYMCLQTPRLHIDNQYIVATIWLSIEDDMIVLRNITSNQRSFLSIEEYNSIVVLFYKNVIQKAKLVGVSRTLSKPTLDLRDLMGAKCAEALVEFSNCSNKDSVLAHDTDFKRWAKFIKLSNSTRARISADQLESWLIENGWRDKCAEKLAIYYEYSINLLSYV